MRKIEAGKPVGDLPIGEIFEYEGKGKLCVAKNEGEDIPDCLMCAFGWGEMECQLADNGIKPFCVSDLRTDKKNIYYKQI